MKFLFKRTPFNIVSNDKEETIINSGLLVFLFLNKKARNGIYNPIRDE